MSDSLVLSQAGLAEIAAWLDDRQVMMPTSTVRKLFASHAALAEQLAQVRANLAATVDELRDERETRQRAESVVAAVEQLAAHPAGRAAVGGLSTPSPGETYAIRAEYWDWVIAALGGWRVARRQSVKPEHGAGGAER